MLRIHAGTARGRKLIEPPAGINTRVTSNRVRSALFDILRPQIHEASVLDAFAGSGSLGIEALSQGANHCTFIEIEPVCCNVIRKNIQLLGWEEKTFIMEIDCREALKILGQKQTSFDITIMDPPYTDNNFSLYLSQIKNNNLLENNGIIILEHAAHTELNDTSGFVLQKQYHYGQTVLSVLC